MQMGGCDIRLLALSLVTRSKLNFTVPNWLLDMPGSLVERIMVGLADEEREVEQWNAWGR